MKLSHLDWGNADKPTLILLHGMADHARSWDWTARALRDEWHVVAPDLRGHGDSEWSPDGAYLTPYHDLDLAALIDMIGKDQVTIVGHSFGGNLASRYTGMFPERVRRLVLVDGFGPSPATYAHWVEAGVVNRARSWVEQRRSLDAKPERSIATLEKAAAKLRAGNPRLSAEQADHLAFHGAHAQGEGFRWKFDPRIRMFAPEDFSIALTNFWHRITLPTLICYGVESWNENPETNGYADHFVDRRVIGFDDAGHWPHHERFDAFVQALRDFL